MNESEKQGQSDVQRGVGVQRRVDRVFAKTAAKATNNEERREREKREE